ncbi:hypothetical protein AUK40_06300 [Candidatus Wirthbacteria bacterium CG2_30_54_11]|uniref:Uncharacterized protein n=1 Tax=Candidatus Wirthbacteria bacterium CG2_30_54_11 TaxID=1817892 RepID=A0A1J5IDF3_9BACT|nr:MAG: hypothetical protein AUK40_06300 [Candidatus Wirthbacteria bacterium CG2_30_54_11]
MEPTQQQVAAWHEQYKTSLSGWTETIDAAKVRYAELIKNSWARSKYVVRNSPVAPDQMVICPPHSSLNQAPNQQHRGDYGTGIFEGGSAEPVLDASGAVTGINVVLHQPRIERFVRSMKARGFQLSVPIEQFSQSMLDIVAVHGTDVLLGDDDKPTRAYIRPGAGPGVGPWGVSFKPGYLIESSNIVFRWGSYFPDADRVYRTEGVKAVITGVRRMFPITGKHASNYGAAAADGNIARSMNYDELIYMAPYGIRDGEMDFSGHRFDDLMKYGAIADGPGEEVFGILKDGGTLIYTPMRTNRLGGTVLNYVITHIAPRLGLKTVERDLTLADIRSGEIAGLAYAGNAVKVVPIGSIDLVRPVSDTEGEKVETLYAGGIHPTIARLRDQWEDEVTGKLSPSHSSLLTPIDLKWGQEMKDYLDGYWAGLGFTQLI